MTVTIKLINDGEVHVNEPDITSENDRGITVVRTSPNGAQVNIFYPYTSVMSITKSYPPNS